MQLWPEKQSKNDVLDYTLANGTLEQQDEATRVLYAEFGAEVGGQASVFVGSNLPLTLAGAGIGHVVARYSSNTSSELQPPAPDNEVATRQYTDAGPASIKR